MKNYTFRSACSFLSGLLLASGTFCAQAGTGTIQGQIKAVPLGMTPAVGSMVEALNATDATVVQTAVVNGDDSFTLTLPPGAYRICFRFARSAGNFTDGRSFYNAESRDKPIIFCFSKGTIINVVEDTRAEVTPLVGYNVDPMLVALTPAKISGTVTDLAAQPLQDITVELLDECSANVIWTVTNDVDGTFVIADKTGKGIPYAPWKIRFLDPSGRYATSFHRADDFVGASLVGPFEEVIKVLQLKPQDIEVSPLSHDFGDVALPGSATAIVTIANRGGADLQVTSVSLADATSSYITMNNVPPLPLTLTAGQSCEVTLEFNPAALGTATATLEVGSDDPDEGTVQVALSGLGVASESPPAEQVATTLEFIEDSAAEGTLQGTGPAGAADAHLQALLNQIKAASDLAAAGKLTQACQQLANAMQRTDGDPQPPDFVTGPAAAELRLLIELTRAAIGCQ